MEKKRYIAPKADNEMMVLEDMISASVTNIAGDTGLGMGFGDPAASGDKSAASRGSFWDDTE